MTEQERYDQYDLPFYRAQVAPALPGAVLDFHTHVWMADQWKTRPTENAAAGGKYMVVDEAYSLDMLAADGARMFPDRPYHAVCFGSPSPAADTAKTNAYAARATGYAGLYPLLVAGRGMLPRAELATALRAGGFFGYKVFLNWHGDDYGNLAVEDLIGPDEMALADELGLVVLLHVPRSGRLADPEIQRGVIDYARRYPNTRIVLAHCGRCYLPDEMQAAVGCLRGLENVYLDTAMVMDPTVLEIALAEIGPRRLLFATDLPIAGMRGRRVYVQDHWVDLVLDGYPPSAYRVGTDNMRATFMVYEIILAIRRAAERIGLTATELAGIYWDNGMALLERALDGAPMQALRQKAAK